MGKKKRKPRGMTDQIRLGVTQSVGSIALGKIAPQVPASGAEVVSGVMAGQRLASISSIVGGAKVTLDSLRGLSTKKKKR